MSRYSWSLNFSLLNICGSCFGSLESPSICDTSYISHLRTPLKVKFHPKNWTARWVSLCFDTALKKTWSFWVPGMILPWVPKKNSGAKTNIAGKWTQIQLTMYLQVMMWNHIYLCYELCLSSVQGIHFVGPFVTVENAEGGSQKIGSSLHGASGLPLERIWGGIRDLCVL